MNGTQTGEGFGSSIVTGDVNRDGYEDILIGSPFYNKENVQKKGIYSGKYMQESGRISYYRRIPLNRLNKDDYEFESVKFELVATLEGETAFSRFGYSMSNLGNLDSFPGDEYAVSAPIYDDNQGAVYILSFINNELKIIQKILPKDSGLEKGLIGNFFGQSLSRSNVDVDKNGYSDIGIGTLTQAVVLNTKPVVLDYYTMRLLDRNENNGIKSIDFVGNSRCRYSKKEKIGNSRAFLLKYAQCYKLEVCLKYRGRHLPKKLDLEVVANLDAGKTGTAAVRLWAVG